MNKHRVDYIDALRGILILIMIMGHVDFGAAFDKYIHAFHMPAWFFLSGYFWNYDNLSYGEFVKKKIKAFIVPYFFAGMIQYPLWIFFVWDKNVSALEPIKNLFWCNTSLIMPIAGALWFLTCLFWAENIFYLLRKIKNSTLMISLVFFTALVGCLYTRLFSGRLPWGIDVSFVAVGLIWMGYIFRKFEIFIQPNILQRSNFCISLLFILQVILIFVNGSVNLRTGNYACVLLFWTNCILSVVLLMNAGKRIDDMKNILGGYTYLCNIGKNSIIYLCFNQLAILLSKSIVLSTFIGKMNWLVRGITILFLSMGILSALDSMISRCKIRKLFGR